MATIAERYARLRAEVPAHVTIVAVTKFQPVEAVREAIAAGVTDVGENYVQEARTKYCHGEVSIAERLEREASRPDAGDHPEASKGLELVRKHFIGHIQTNKAKAIAATFDVVQSVDRIEAGLALSKAASALGKRLPVLVQVNISPSERYGCSPEDAERIAEQLRELESLCVQGVMAIGPITEDREVVRAAFEEAALIHRRIGGETLSIGMSGDWTQAVQAGSTMIRVGSTIFGPRPTRPVSKNAVM